MLQAQRWYNGKMDSFLGISPDAAQGRVAGVGEEAERDRQTSERVAVK